MQKPGTGTGGQDTQRSSSCVLACDVGSSGLRMALVDINGGVQSLYRHAGMAVTSSASAADEINPAGWWDALIDGAAVLARDAPQSFNNISAIAISGMTRTQIFVDNALQPIGPVMLWSDTQAETTLQGLLDRLPATHPETRNINAFHALARLWWLRATRPAAYESLAHVLDPKDYLNAMLTGVCASDTVSLARLDAAASPHKGKSLLDAADIHPHIIPKLAKPISIMGHVRRALPGALAKLANVPVVTMAHDTFASVAGLGALRTGFAYNLSGTTEVLGLISGQARAAEGLLTVDWSEGLIQVGGPSLAGGDTLQWLLQLVEGESGKAGSVEAALERLSAMPLSPQPLLFLPYLRGERVPYWDAALRGAWIGLSRDHGPADLVHSVLEGIAFLNRIVIERAEDAIGSRAQELRFGGGGSTNPQWCQIKADILGRTVVATDSVEHGLIGAAIIAWTALGTQPDLDTAQDALVRVTRRYQPDPARQSAYNVLFGLFRETERTLGPISRRLAGLTRPIS